MNASEQRGKMEELVIQKEKGNVSAGGIKTRERCELGS